MNKSFKTLSIFLGALGLLSVTACQGQSTNDNTTQHTTSVSTDGQKKIQIALLLDASNSMDGLIEQAKSQLWSLVNELSSAQCNGVKPQLQIALYQYGKQSLSAESGYIQQLSGFTGELDEISAKLFSLTTNGGDEFCGQVIQKAISDLSWSDNSADLKFIFIAGNEAFNQGRVNYVTSCLNAKTKDIVVNTIFCGDFNEGINTQWKVGADIASGDYMSINHNQKTVYVATPYDNRLDSLNTLLNQTYIYYGSQGVQKYQLQNSQDQNANTISKENKIERTVSKGSSFYKNESWDLVDKADGKNIENTLKEVDVKTLPKEMQTMNEEERVKYVVQKSNQRAAIQKEIAETSTKRQSYIDAQNTTNQTNLNSVMSESVKKKAISKNYTFIK